jgi:hypothetical protein
MFHDARNGNLEATCSPFPEHLLAVHLTQESAARYANRILRLPFLDLLDSKRSVAARRSHSSATHRIGRPVNHLERQAWVTFFSGIP